MTNATMTTETEQTLSTRPVIIKIALNINALHKALQKIKQTTPNIVTTTESIQNEDKLCLYYTKTPRNGKEINNLQITTKYGALTCILPSDSIYDRLTPNLHQARQALEDINFYCKSFTKIEEIVNNIKSKNSTLKPKDKQQYINLILKGDQDIDELRYIDWHTITLNNIDITGNIIIDDGWRGKTKLNEFTNGSPSVPLSLTDINLINNTLTSALCKKKELENARTKAQLDKFHICFGARQGIKIETYAINPNYCRSVTTKKGEEEETDQVFLITKTDAKNLEILLKLNEHSPTIQYKISTEEDNNVLEYRFKESQQLTYVYHIKQNTAPTWKDNNLNPQILHPHTIASFNINLNNLYHLLTKRELYTKREKLATDDRGWDADKNTKTAWDRRYLLTTINIEERSITYEIFAHLDADKTKNYGKPICIAQVRDNLPKSCMTLNNQIPNIIQFILDPKLIEFPKLNTETKSCTADIHITETCATELHRRNKPILFSMPIKNDLEYMGYTTTYNQLIMPLAKKHEV